MIKVIWRFIADSTMIGMLYGAWFIGCLSTIEHWGWHGETMSIIAIAPMVLTVIVLVFADGFVRAHEKAKHD